MRVHVTRTILRLAVALLPLGSPPAAAQELPDWVRNTRISGSFFGDAYGVVAHHDPSIEGENGFWFRRLYLTFDAKVAENTDVRVRFEASSPGDFSTSRNLEAFVKDLHVRWKQGRHEIVAGLSPSVTWELLERHWGYRSVERTPLDLYRWGSSRDIGIAVRGALDDRKLIRYNIMFANGEGTKSETDDGKKLMAAVSFHPTAAWTFEVYGDADNRPAQTDRTTWQVFAGYGRPRGRFGLLYARQTREISATEEIDLGVASIFGVVRVGDRYALLGRVDRVLDPIPGGNTVDYISFDPTARATFALFGLDVALNGKVSLIPNVEAVAYDAVDGGPNPDNDLIARLTLSAEF